MVRQAPDPRRAPGRSTAGHFPNLPGVGDSSDIDIRGLVRANDKVGTKHIVVRLNRVEFKALPMTAPRLRLSLSDSLRRAIALLHAFAKAQKR